MGLKRFLRYFKHLAGFFIRQALLFDKPVGQLALLRKIGNRRFNYL